MEIRFIIGVLLISTHFCFSKKKPNILLIVADDLGYSDLGCYGGEINTPNLDQLANNGVRLTQFYNTGRCCPSRASLLTGQYPHRVGLGHMTQDIGHPGYRGRVSPDAQTIAQALQPAGYRSFLSGKWHLGTDDPTRHGFEAFYGTLVSAKTFWDPHHFKKIPNKMPPVTWKPGTFHGTDALGLNAKRFLQKARTTPEKPWFLYLAFNAPHFPLHAFKHDIKKYSNRYQGGWDELRKERLNRMKKLGVVDQSTQLTPRSPWWNYGETQTGENPAWKDLPKDRRDDLARRMAIYAAMVDQMDRCIGSLVDDLRKKKELDNTFILFTADNGACAEWDPKGFDIKSSNQNILFAPDRIDEMGQPGTFHSTGSGWANAGNTPWRLYKHFNHEGGIASPGIVHWPEGNFKKGIIEHRPAHIIDILPTCLQLAGLEESGKLPLPGRSLLPQLLQQKLPSRTLYFEHEGNRALRKGRWKLVATAGQAWELYDISKDRTELKNLAIKKPELLKKLANNWRSWARENQVTPLPKNYNVGYLKVRK